MLNGDIDNLQNRLLQKESEIEEKVALNKKISEELKAMDEAKKKLEGEIEEKSGQI